MATIFGHAISAIAIGSTTASKMKSTKFWILAIFCTILPDFDVISFNFGIAYGDFWGHRGFTHSLLFALITGIIITSIFYIKGNSIKSVIGYIIFFFICTASHGIIDAFTSGGLGVAFFSPWDNSRYFFPWQPIKVSPLGVGFFSSRGLQVLLSEAIWIGIPSSILISISFIIKRIFQK